MRAFLFFLAAVSALAVDAPDFSYDASPPVDLQEILSVTRGSVVIRDVTFADVDRFRTSAYVVMPAQAAPRSCAGVLFAHWYESGSPTAGRQQFLEQAIRLAGEGTASLLIETMWSPQNWFPTRNRALDQRNSVQQVRRLRRAVDVLAGLPCVDPARLAYVGHDFGAMYGAVLARADERIHLFAFIAGTADFQDWFQLGARLTPEQAAEEKARVAPLAPVKAVQDATHARFLMQFGERDRFVPKEKAQEVAAAAGERAKVLWYDTGHGMNAQADADRLAWLREVLRLKAARR